MTVILQPEAKKILTERTESSWPIGPGMPSRNRATKSGQLAELRDLEGRSPVGHHYKRLLRPLTGPISRHGKHSCPSLSWKYKPCSSPQLWRWQHKLERPSDKALEMDG